MGSASNGDKNCMTVPLQLQSAPLCAVVAAKDVKDGKELMQGLKLLETKVMEECNSILAKEFKANLSELKAYIEMACKRTLDTKLGRPPQYFDFIQRYHTPNLMFQNPSLRCK